MSQNLNAVIDISHFNGDIEFEAVASAGILGIIQKATTIPATAVLHGQEDLYAYVVKPDNKVESRPIKTGYATEQFYVVKDGIKVGETVVTGGQYRLTNGTLVAINKGGGDQQPSEQQAAK